MATMGERLRTLMDQAKITPTELARRLDVRAETVSRWLSDERHPKRARMPVIAAILGVPLRELQSPEGAYIMPAINHFAAADQDLPGEWDRLDDRERRAVAEVVRLLARRRP